ncbi:MAG: CpaF family protein [Planctomycetota bacterium]
MKNQLKHLIALDPTSQKKRRVYTNLKVVLFNALNAQMPHVFKDDFQQLAEEQIYQIKGILLNVIKAQNLKDYGLLKLNYEEVVDEILAELYYYGPIADLMNSRTISEVMVNRHDEVFIEKSGKILLTDKTFLGEDHLIRTIQEIVSLSGRHIDRDSPLVDSRLPDGSRLNAILPPCSLRGPMLTIRKFMTDLLTPEDLIQSGAISQSMIELLKLAVKHKKNIIISGGTGTGKTTLLNIMSSFIPFEERIVSIEDSAELKLQQKNIGQLEAKRPISAEQRGVTLRDLFINTLRMRPDRIVVGECRGAEALDMLQAMNTGHEGSMTTLHANSAVDALSRLETLVLMAGLDLPVEAIRKQIGSAVHLIVQLTRFEDGSRKITEITEITGMTGDVISRQDIFRFYKLGVKEGKVHGEFRPTGIAPKFFQELREQGVSPPMELIQ